LSCRTFDSKTLTYALFKCEFLKEEHFTAPKRSTGSLKRWKMLPLKYNIRQLVIEYHGVNFVENCVDSTGR